MQYTDDRRAPLLAVCIIFLILSTTAVALRCYVRLSLIKSFGWDDGLMVACYMFYLMFVICALGGLRYGTGLHYDELDPDKASIALLYWWLCEIWYVFASCLGKIAVGVFLLRIAVKRWHIWIIRILNAGTVAFGIFYFTIFIVQCHPIHSFWEETPASKNCNDPHIITDATYGASAVNSAADWTLGLLPIFIVWDVQMRTKMKFTVAGILGLAAIGNTATIVRIPFVDSFLDTDDFLWATTWIAVCSTLEVGIGITAACIATLRPLMRRGFNSTHQTGSNGYMNPASRGPRSKAFGRSATGYDDIDLEARSPSRIHNQIGKNMTLTQTTITRASSEGASTDLGLDYDGHQGHAKSQSVKQFMKKNGSSGWRTSGSDDHFAPYSASEGLEINKSVGVEVTYSDAEKERTKEREVV